MEFRVLGPIEVVRQGRTLALGGTKPRTLLAVLVARANEVVSADRLADELWGDDPPGGAVAVLQVHVSNLRKVLEPERAGSAPPRVLVTRPPGYVLCVDPDHVDALRFEALVASARQALRAGEPAQAGPLLRQALDLWRGPPLADLGDHPFAQAYARHLEELRLGAVEDLYDAELALGRHAEAVGELSALVGAHPLRERLVGQLMLGLYRSGRQAEALATYRQARRELVEGLGIDPGPALQDLERAILNQDPALGHPAPAPAAMALPGWLQSPWELRFIGRGAEMETLARAWKRAMAGERRVVMVAGEPGIGKTRLVSETAVVAHAEGARVLYGRCDPELGVPYQPFIEVIGQYVGACGDAELAEGAGTWGAELVRIVPELARRLPDLPLPAAADPETERYRLFEAVVALLARASRQGPVMVVLEDLHWATKPTALLLRHVLAAPEPMAVLVVATHRPTDVSPDHPLSEALADLRRQRGVERVALGGLAPDDVLALVEHAAGHHLDEAGVALAGTLWRETDGNPFFVTEILRHLADTGQGADAASLAAPRQIPDSIREVITQRVNRLSGGASEALAVAAVIGPEFDLPLAGRVSAVEEGQMLDLLDEASSAGLVTELASTPRSYCFSHRLIRDAVYDSLGGTRRARLHRQVAEALETDDGASDSALTALAHHWFSAGGEGDPHRAVRYARAAGHQAVAELAYEEACAFFERALAVTDTHDTATESLRCDLLLALGDAQVCAGDSAHRATMSEAAGIARRIQDHERLARAALGSTRGHAWFAEVGKVDEPLLAIYEEALASLPPGDSVLRARLQSQIAVETYWSRERERRFRLCEEATAMARRLGDGPGLGRVLAAQVVAIWDPTTLDQRVSLLAELLSLAVELDNAELIFRAHLFSAVSCFEAADLTRAKEHLARAVELAAALRQPFWSWLTKTVQTTLLLLDGSPDAEESVYEGFRLGQECAQPDAPVLLAVQLCIAWWDRGRIAEIVSFLRPFVDEMPAAPRFRAGLSFALCEEGRLEEAREQFEILAWPDFDLPVDWAWSSGMTLLAETCVVLDDRERARRLYTMLLPFADQLVVVGLGQFCLGSVSRSLGCLATTLGLRDEAEAHFEHALAVNERIGAKTFLVRTQRAFAAMLLDGNPRQAARGAELAAAALRQAVALGMGLEPDRLRDLTATPASSARRRAAGLWRS